MKLRTLRILLQILFFLVFAALFFLTQYPYAGRVPVDLFLRLDPLVALVTMAATRIAIPTLLIAFALLALAFFLGRFFCGYLCPLGALMDFLSIPSYRKNPAQAGRGIKYLILIAVVAAALLGWNTLSVLSPMAITPRLFTFVLYPPLIKLANAGLDVLRPAFSYAGMDTLAQVSFSRPFFSGWFPTLILFGLIVAAAYWRRRFWCRIVCPTGALFSLVSRFSSIRRTVNGQRCNDCGRCSAECKMGAIRPDFKTLSSECILCGNCAAVCRHNAIAFAPRRGEDLDSSIPLGRRRFLLSAGAGLAAAAVVKAGPASAKEDRFIRPPGSVPEPEFLARCIRCGACNKGCPTYGLQPAGMERGLDGLWTPRLISRIGGCEEKCNVCGWICPTHAIRALPLEEKRFVKIGEAVLDEKLCIVWKDDKACLICDEICPYDAIEFRWVTNPKSTLKRPVVLKDKCTGCGLCETKCPIAGRSAIEIYSIGQERKREGSYITPEKRKLREIKGPATDSLKGGEALPEGFILE
jgi:MauM/NapG family ferredoxin protein